MFKIHELLLLILLSVLTAISFLNTTVCYANSAPGPSIIIIVSNAPRDLTISIEPGNFTSIRRIDRVNESYYLFFIPDIFDSRINWRSPISRVFDLFVKVTTEDRTFKVAIDTPLKSFSNVLTLDLQKQTLTPGKSLLTTLSLLFTSIILTLIIEGIVFYIFGYRKKKSWFVFLFINLLTQGVLYFCINAPAIPDDNYIIYGLIFGEIIVFIVEMIAFLILINEHSRWRTAFYVLLANSLSLIAGGYLITVLPL